MNGYNGLREDDVHNQIGKEIETWKTYDSLRKGKIK